MKDKIKISYSLNIKNIKLNYHTNNKKNIIKFTSRPVIPSKNIYIFENHIIFA